MDATRLYFAVYIEVNLVGIAVLLLILLRNKREIDRQSASLAYTRVVFATIAMLALDVAWVLVEGRDVPGFIHLNYAVNVLYLSVSVVVNYLWFRFVLIKLDSLVIHIKAFWRLAVLPLAGVCIMSLLTPWTHWMFDITAGNIYERRPLHVVQQAVCYAYLFAALAISLLHAKRTKNPEKRSEALTMSAFAVMPAIGGVVNAFLYGMPTVWPFAAISLLMVHQSLQRHMILTDELTGLNNRRQFDRYLALQAEDPREGEQLNMILIDVDAFKHINDTYGHLTGDAALVQTAGILKRVCGKWSVFLARYGGDEFAIIFWSRDPGVAARLKSDLIAAFAEFSGSADADTPYALSISAGCGAVDVRTESIEALIAEADKKLYEEKERKRAAGVLPLR